MFSIELTFELFVHYASPNLVELCDVGSGVCFASAGFQRNNAVDAWSAIDGV